ncbi:hypothetical protein DL762_007017 [Monosporascus cannonballus]|uniref:Uncharacterized protein n=1 Tax=Monosporascus cannonballus TaxID=155416 RepID=A0ABY0H0S2_9PEZI|nr:hypothetical protein DL762_007017 [Monosporascus cannonballus]RYO94129.1 hypothetical protein DL763_004197 [Monosporascus cannonballus]
MISKEGYGYSNQEFGRGQVPQQGPEEQGPEEQGPEEQGPEEQGPEEQGQGLEQGGDQVVDQAPGMEHFAIRLPDHFDTVFYSPVRSNHSTRRKINERLKGIIEIMENLLHFERQRRTRVGEV